ncbi:MAG: hypothetical protein OEY33_03340, partial [Bdellovibrionales bacterium]|nr:hypothetical protein [Bdellovibrionales bacterium]
MRKYRYSNLWKTITFGYLIIIAYFSLKTPSPEVASYGISDKLLHFLAYLFAAFFFSLVIKKKYLSLIFIFLSFYG